MTYLFTATRKVTVDGSGTFKETATINHPGAPVSTSSDAEHIRLLRWCGVLGLLDQPAWQHSNYEKESLMELPDDETGNLGNAADIDITFQRYTGNLNPKIISFRVENVTLDNVQTTVETKFNDICFTGYSGSGTLPKSINVTLHN